MKTMTLFSFGYWGWGNATTQLVQSIDAVENARGHAPPMFVDVRLSRSVRAKGFDGRAFENLLGPDRYRWINALGNLGIQDGAGMRIKDPAAAHTLLDIAEQCAAENRRVLFFCACEKPGVEDHNGCHRTAVARLALEAAGQRKQWLEVVEWPGGEPQLVGLEVLLSRPEFDKVRRGAVSIPLEDPVALARMAALPWYSLVYVHANDGGGKPSWRLMTGPAKYRKTGWYLPVYGGFDGEPPEAIRAAIQRAREADGYQARRTRM